MKKLLSLLVVFTTIFFMGACSKQDKADLNENETNLVIEKSLDSQSRSAQVAKELTDKMHETWRQSYRAKKGDEPRFKEVPLQNGESAENSLERLKGQYSDLKIEDDKLMQNINQPADKIIPSLNYKLNGGPALDYAKVVVGKSIKSSQDVEDLASGIHQAWMKHNSWQKESAPNLFRPYKDLNAAEKIKDLDVLADALEIDNPQALKSKEYLTYRESLEKKILDEQKK